MYSRRHSLLFSPDFEVIGPHDDGSYSLSTTTMEEADDFLGLNPKKRYPEGSNITHLSGEARSKAQNTIRQRKFQRKRNLKLRW